MAVTVGAAAESQWTAIARQAVRGVSPSHHTKHAVILALRPFQRPAVRTRTDGTDARLIVRTLMPLAAVRPPGGPVSTWLEDARGALSDPQLFQPSLRASVTAGTSQSPTGVPG
jgi:hypothetical protein